jgi:hypothetical protein
MKLGCVTTMNLERKVIMESHSPNVYAREAASASEQSHRKAGAHAVGPYPDRPDIPANIILGEG